MTSWKNAGQQTKILEVFKEDAKCLLCNFGKEDDIQLSSIHGFSEQALIEKTENPLYFN